MRLWLRLFIACALLSTASLAGFVAWERMVFSHGFAAYLDAITTERMKLAATRLSLRYATAGSWDFLHQDPRLFGSIVAPEAPGEAADPAQHRRPPPALPPDIGDPGSRPREQGPAGPPAALDPPPSPRGEAGSAISQVRPGGPPPHDSFEAGWRIALFDEENRYVAGNPRAAPTGTGVVVVYAGKQVGTLRSAPASRSPLGLDAIEAAFAESQLRQLIIAGVIVLLLALVLALVVSRALLGRVQALAAGTHALARGDYAHRLPTAGSDELAALARHFNELAETLEQHREARRRWGADIAHELRTPLAILRAELTTLIDGIRPTDNAALQSLMYECERLSALTEDLYQLALADAGALEYRFETLDLVDVVGDADYRQRRSLAERGLTLRAELPDTAVLVRGDRARLAQLFDNLLVNSGRYTDAPGQVVVRVVVQGQHAVMSIDDSAPGVPTDALPQLFERLFRVDGTRSRSSGGAGLGLAICRAIVDAHAGSINATSSRLGGLRVVVELPLISEDTA